MADRKTEGLEKSHRGGLLSDFFLDGSDATHRAIAIGVVKNGAELDFIGFEAGEITVLVENFSATVAKVVMNFSLHSCINLLVQHFVRGDLGRGQPVRRV